MKRLLILLAVSAGMTGCATWEPVREDLRTFIVDQRPSSVLVLRENQEPLRIRSPRLDREGRLVGERFHTRGVTEAIELQDISELLAREFHTGRTVVAIAVPSLIIAVAIFAATFYVGVG